MSMPFGFKETKESLRRKARLEFIAKNIAYICCVRTNQKTMQDIHQFVF